MTKRMKKPGVILLSLLAALMLTLPVLAVPSGTNALLNIRYAPGGVPANGVPYTLYRVADAAPGEAGTVYTLTEAFAASGLDVDSAMAGASQVSGTDAQRTLLNAAGTYVNETHVSGVQVTTAQKNIGRDGALTDGIAQFSNLEAGLYLAASNAAVTINGTVYTAVPFLVVMDGAANSYVTASVKFTTNTPSPDIPTPPGPGPDPTPTPTPDPSPSTPPNPTPNTPSDPVPDPTPTPNPDPTPVIEILPEDVPLIDLPDVPGQLDQPDQPDDLQPDLEIPDEDVPLAMLPQTGLLWWPVYVMAALGLVFLVLGVYTKKRTERDA